MLEILDCSKNKLFVNGIPFEIGKCVKMKRLLLSENELTVLPTEIGDMAALEYLDISTNQIAAIPREFEGLVKIETFLGDINLVAGLPTEFKAWGRLKKFSLKQNKLTHFPAELCVSWKELETLSLSVNPLVDIPQHFAYLQSLTECDISFCVPLKKVFMINLYCTI